MSVDIEKICRTCLGLSGPLLSIYDGDTKSNNCLAGMLQNFTNIKPKLTDNMPSKVCLTCISEINHCYSFKIKCENSNRTLRQLLPDALPEESEDEILEQNRPQLLSKDTQTNPENQICTNTVETQTYEIESEKVVLNDTVKKTIANKKSLLSLKRKATKPVAYNKDKLRSSYKNASLVIHTEAKDYHFEQNNSESSNSCSSPKTLKTLNHATENTESYKIECNEENEFIIDFNNATSSTRSPIQHETAVVLEDVIVTSTSNKADDTAVYEITQSNDSDIEIEPFAASEVEEDDSTSLSVSNDKVILIKNTEKTNNNGNQNEDAQKFKCFECTITLDNFEKLQQHMSELHAMEITEEIQIDKEQTISNSKYFCSQCKSPFATKRSLNTHKKLNICFKESHQCDICERFFEAADQLEAHKIEKHESATIPCPNCKKSFYTQEELSEHQIKAHRRNGRNQCMICKKVFSMLSTLREHLRTHSGEKPFSCEICGKSFTQSSNMKQHVKRHNEDKQYKCSICPERFVTKAELVSHSRVHTGEQPYKCSYCSAAFSSQCTLIKHSRRHTGERPYACDKCPMRFNALNVLNNHKRTHSGEKPFKCDYCERRFTQKGDCFIHMIKHQKTKKSYYCVCGKSFPIASRLNYHQKTCLQTIEESKEDTEISST